MIKVEIDEGSGFCFGVVTAIHKAEEELAKGETLYCLGDIVHNSREVERLKAMGLITINRDEFRQLRNAKVLLRAHGEPPETYQIAHKNNIEIIDATCPVVLRLQKRIKQEFRKEDFEEKQIVIYGKNGHVDTSMADGLLAGGAKAVMGYVNNVYSVYSRSMLWATVNRMIEGETLEQAVDYAKSIYGTDDIIWYNEQGGRRPHAAASYAMLSGDRSAALPNPYLSLIHI
mgnify:CR=1 FL=1